MNWSATYTGYLTDNFSMKALYGENEREFAAHHEQHRPRVQPRPATGAPSGVGDRSGLQPPARASLARTDTREAARLDFEWVLGDHQLRFGLDHETNTSEHSEYNPGPGAAALRDLPRTPRPARS